MAVQKSLTRDKQGQILPFVPKIGNPPDNTVVVVAGGVVTVSGTASAVTSVYVRLFNPTSGNFSDMFAIPTDVNGNWGPFNMTGINPANFPGRSILTAQEDPLPNGALDSHVVMLQ